MCLANLSAYCIVTAISTSYIFKQFVCMLHCYSSIYWLHIQKKALYTAHFHSTLFFFYEIVTHDLYKCVHDKKKSNSLDRMSLEPSRRQLKLDTVLEKLYPACYEIFFNNGFQVDSHKQNDQQYMLLFTSLFFIKYENFMLRYVSQRHKSCPDSHQ